MLDIVQVGVLGLIVMRNIKAEVKTLLDQVSAKLSIGVGKILQALRVSITGGGSGPDLMLTIEIIGPKEASSRISTALQTFTIKQ